VARPVPERYVPVRANCLSSVLAAVIFCAGAIAETRVDLNALRQEVRGFGGSEGFNIMEAAFMQTRHSTRRDCMDIAFRDLDATVLRIPLDCRFEQDRSGNYFYYVPALAAWYAAEASSRGNIRQYFGSPWSPPAWMKGSKVSTGGSLDNRLLRENYENFARYLAKWHRHLDRFYGIRMDYVSLQNEPEANVSWDSCVYSSQELIDLLKIADRAFKSEGVSAGIMAPEHSMPLGSIPFLGLIKEDRTAFDALGAFAVHLYNDADWGFAGAVRNAVPGKGFWMTETCFLKKDELFRTIRKHLYDWGLNYWCWWRTLGGWEALVTFDKEGGYRVEPPYYAFKGIVNFIRPGMRIVDVTTSDLKDQPIAAVGPDGAFAIAFLNAGSKNKTTTITGLGGIQTLHRHVDGAYAGDESVSDGTLKNTTLAAGAVTTFSSFRREEPKPAVRVVVDPPAAKIAPGESVTLIPRVLGIESQKVQWTLLDAEGKAAAGLGTISAEGIYTAPGAMPPGSDAVFARATGASNPEAFFSVPVKLAPTRNLAKGKAAWSDATDLMFPPGRAVDGMPWTMWKGEWLVIDLGEITQYDTVALSFPSSHTRRAWRILDSDDAREWRLVKETTDSDLQEDTVSFDKRRARYLRLECPKAMEIEVYDRL